MKTNKKKMFKVVLLIMLSLVILAIASISVLMYLMFSSLEQVCSPDREKINQITGLNLTKDAKIVGAEYVSALDDCLYLAIDVNKSTLEKIFPEDKYKPSTVIRYLEDFTSREREWFNPDSIINFKSFDYSDPEQHTGMYALYDNSEKKIKRVYVFWFSTQ